MFQQRKVFFALLPEESVLRKIVSLQGLFQSDFQGFLQSSPQDNAVKWTAKQNIHITLCFIGYVDEVTLKCIESSVKPVDGEISDLRLDLIGCFKRVGILWLGSNQKNTALSMLYHNVVANLGFCGVDVKRQEFVPHVTLARLARSARWARWARWARKIRHEILVPEFKSIEWNSDRFYLMESIQKPAGVEYKVLKEYTLT